ncbi:hypothetical protein A6A04_11630 [Paramagnetospirillum marisnigri]|uniref:Uncharacterized protein n=1 Tax=Paramagnetospirillum marisnigri TaxID=1285242 RepID=A0A178MVS0_9PROT|nr:hypothetical protein [Paramagnetospirillum marisnigri]OAN54571.1 hypothetical protein A6A04_11630 [Paramagnetospirillum marisnigri]
MSPSVERVASLSPEEFRRHLPLALRGLDHAWVSESEVTVAARGCRVAIHVEELPPLALSEVLSLPRCRIRLEFSGDDPAAWAAFLAAYDRAFQRGGG